MTKTTKIMLVDDEPDLIGLMELKLRNKVKRGEYQLIFASNGEEALELISNHDDLDVIVLDINMPIMDGITLLSKLQFDSTDFDVIMLSAYSDMAHVRKAMNYGAYDYLSKPIDFKEFQSTLDRTIDRVKNKRIYNQKQRQEISQFSVTKIQEERLNSLKDSLFSMISYEYRNPLTIIQSSADIIENLYNKPGRAEEMEKFLSGIRGSVKFMARTLDDVIKISKLDFEDYNQQKTNIDLKDLLWSMLYEMKLADNSKHHISFDAEGSFEYYYGNETILKLAIANVLSNAFKYSPLNSQIKVVIRNILTHFIIIIEDSGIGINEADIENIFEPYRRGKNVSSIPGAGLGLHIVKKCIDLLDGEISLTNKDGSGTICKIHIPKNIEQ